MMNLIENKLYEMAISQMEIANSLTAERDDLKDDEKLKLIINIEKFKTDEILRSEVIEAMKEGLLEYMFREIENMGINRLLCLEEELFFDFGYDAYIENVLNK